MLLQKEIILKMNILVLCPLMLQNQSTSLSRMKGGIDWALNQRQILFLFHTQPGVRKQKGASALPTEAFPTMFTLVYYYTYQNGVGIGAFIIPGTCLHALMTDTSCERKEAPYARLCFVDDVGFGK